MRPVHRILVLSFAANLLCGFAAATETTSAPATGIYSAPEILAIMRKACDYQITTATGTGRNDWIRSAFYTGVMATYYTTGERKYLDQATRWGREANWTPDARNNRHADNQCCGQTYGELYLLEKDPAMIEPFRSTVDQMMSTPKPGRQDWWWCDALFMAPTAYSRLAACTADERYLKFMNELFWDSTDYLFDPEVGLYYRDHNYFDKRTANGKRVFWSRGNGWVFAGIPRILQYLPANNPRRGDFVKLFRQMAGTLARIQGEDGMWRSSLLDPDHFPLPESSGSGFFCFGFAWGINTGLLDRELHQPVVEKAWKGLVGVVTPEGKVGHVQKVAGAPGKVNPEDTHEYAVGAFLLAGSEVVKLMNPDFKPAVVPPGVVTDFTAFVRTKDPAAGPPPKPKAKRAPVSLTDTGTTISESPAPIAP